MIKCDKLLHFVWVAENNLFKIKTVIMWLQIEYGRRECTIWQQWNRSCFCRFVAVNRQNSNTCYVCEMRSVKWSESVVTERKKIYRTRKNHSCWHYKTVSTRQTCFYLYFFIYKILEPWWCSFRMEKWC